jgi:hypothetical protein
VTSSGGNREELDSMTVEIELTLCSIIQGVALYFLVDNARLVLSGGQSAAWPYAVTGLLIILLFWSRSLIHTLTLIRWPLEFVHNFFYIACALVESLAFTRLADPFMWFVMTALFAAVVWALFIFDLRIVRLRGKDSAGPIGSQLYAMVGRDQRLNIRIVMPAIFFFNAACALGIHARPEFFLNHNGHLILILLQAIGLLFYLGQVIRSFIQFVPLISATRQEWRDVAEIAHRPS